MKGEKCYMAGEIKVKWKILLFMSYTFFLLYITLLGRSQYEPLSAVWKGWGVTKVQGHWNLDPIGNILMFIPWTYSLCGAFPRFRGSNIVTTVRKAMVISFCFSAFIECMQLILSLGTFQVSDLVYNTISGWIGGLAFEILHTASKQNI